MTTQNISIRNKCSYNNQNFATERLPEIIQFGDKFTSQLSKFNTNMFVGMPCGNALQANRGPFYRFNKNKHSLLIQNTNVFCETKSYEKDRNKLILKEKILNKTSRFDMIRMVLTKLWRQVVRRTNKLENKIKAQG